MFILLFTAQAFMKIEVPEYIEDSSSSHRPTSQQQTHLTHHNENEDQSEEHLTCVDEDEDNQAGPEESTFNIDDQDSDMELMYTTGHESEIGTLHKSAIFVFDQYSTSVLCVYLFLFTFFSCRCRRSNLHITIINRQLGQAAYRQHYDTHSRFVKFITLYFKLTVRKGSFTVI